MAETSLVPTYDTGSMSASVAKQIRRAEESRQTTERLRMVNDFVKTLLDNKVVTAVGAYVLIEFLQKTYITRTHSYQLPYPAGGTYEWAETVPVIPDTAGTVLEGGIIAWLTLAALSGEDGGTNWLDLAKAIFLKGAA